MTSLFTVSPLCSPSAVPKSTDVFCLQRRVYLTLDIRLKITVRVLGHTHHSDWCIMYQFWIMPNQLLDFYFAHI